MAVYFSHLDDLPVEAVVYAAHEVIRREERGSLPPVAMLRRYAREYKPPDRRGNLATVALPEFTEQEHEEAARRLDAIMDSLEAWGNA